VTYSTILAAKVKMKFLFLLFKYTPSLLQPIPTPHHSYLKQPSHTLHQRAVAATINIPPNYHCRRKGAIFLLFLCSLQQHTVAAATKYSTQHTAHSTQHTTTQHTTHNTTTTSPFTWCRTAASLGRGAQRSSSATTAFLLAAATPAAAATTAAAVRPCAFASLLAACCDDDRK